MRELDQGLPGLGNSDLLFGQLSRLATDKVRYSLGILKQRQDVLEVVGRRGRTLVEHGDSMLLPDRQLLGPLLDFAEYRHSWPPKVCRPTTPPPSRCYG